MRKAKSVVAAQPADVPIEFRQSLLALALQGLGVSEIDTLLAPYGLRKAAGRTATANLTKEIWELGDPRESLEAQIALAIRQGWNILYEMDSEHFRLFLEPLLKKARGLKKGLGGFPCLLVFPHTSLVKIKGVARQRQILIQHMIFRGERVATDEADSLREWLGNFNDQATLPNQPYLLNNVQFGAELAGLIEEDAEEELQPSDGNDPTFLHLRKRGRLPLTLDEGFSLYRAIENHPTLHLQSFRLLATTYDGNDAWPNLFIDEGKLSIGTHCVESDAPYMRRYFVPHCESRVGPDGVIKTFI